MGKVGLRAIQPTAAPSTRTTSTHGGLSDIVPDDIHPIPCGQTKQRDAERAGHEYFRGWPHHVTRMVQEPPFRLVRACSPVGGEAVERYRVFRDFVDLA